MIIEKSILDVQPDDEWLRYIGYWCGFNLNVLNSATKYPSILTYHAMGERGRLTSELAMADVVVDSVKMLQINSKYTDIYVTEKIDGVNTRVILYQDDFIIGSRQDLIYAKGDRVLNDKHLIPLINILQDSTGTQSRERLLHPDLWSKYKDNKHIIVVYGELYGGNITKSKSYSSSNDDIGFRVFDIAVIPRQEIFGKCDPTEVSGLLEKNNYFVPVGQIDFRGYLDHHKSLTVPKLEMYNHDRCTGADLPDTIVKAYDFIRRFIDTTEASIDGTTIGKAEGIVIRNYDRSWIRKLRFEDYEKTLAIKRR